MKKLIKTLALVSLTWSVGFAAPIAPKTFHVGMYNPTASHNLKIYVEKAKKDALILELKDKNGFVLQTVYLNQKSEKLGLSLNLSNLSAGAYDLEIKKGNELYSKKIVLVDKVESEKIEF